MVLDEREQQVITDFLSHTLTGNEWVLIYRQDGHVGICSPMNPPDASIILRIVAAYIDQHKDTVVQRIVTASKPQ